VPGSTSFTDLRTVSGELLLTFREAAERRGLIEADNTLHEGLAEATLWMDAICTAKALCNNLGIL
jgi:hypothetical protein